MSKCDVHFPSIACIWQPKSSHIYQYFLFDKRKLFYAAQIICQRSSVFTKVRNGLKSKLAEMGIDSNKLFT